MPSCKDVWMPIIPDAIKDVVVFCKILPPYVVLPEMCPEMDGTMCVYWRDKCVYLVARFRGFGTFAFYGKSYTSDETTGGSNCAINQDNVDAVANFVLKYKDGED